MKKVPGYKKVLKSTTKKTVDDLEKMFKQSWDKNDETLNDGEMDYGDDREDEIFND